MRKLDRNNTALILIDVQEKLFPVIDGHEAVADNIVRLIRGCDILSVPVLVTEQYVKGLGPTVPSIRAALEETTGYSPIEKICFSSYGCSEFVSQVEDLQRDQFLVAGIEAHVCVYQTVLDLLEAGHDVTVIADAVSSRTASNREIALQRMVADGAALSTTEMALFELTVKSGTEEFRAISKLVR